MGLLDDLGEKAKNAKEELFANAKERLTEGLTEAEQKLKDTAAHVVEEGKEAFKKKTGG